MNSVTKCFVFLVRFSGENGTGRVGAGEGIHNVYTAEIQWPHCRALVWFLVCKIRAQEK